MVAEVSLTSSSTLSLPPVKGTSTRPPLPKLLHVDRRLPLWGIQKNKSLMWQPARIRRPYFPEVRTQVMTRPTSPDAYEEPGSAAGKSPPHHRLAAAAPVPWLMGGVVLRLGTTLMLVSLARIGHFIPIPGVPMQVGGRNALELFMGRSVVGANVFALGITPLMSAYFGLAAANLIPSFRKHFASLREEGPQGQELYQAYASGLFVLFAVWEGLQMAHSWLPPHAVSFAAASETLSNVALEATSSSSGVIVPWTIAIMTAGAAICKLITETIEQHGLGDGAGLIIALGVAVNYAHFVTSAASQLVAAPPHFFAAFIVVALCVGLIAVLFWAQSVELRLPISFYQTHRTRVQKQHPLRQLLSKQEVHQQQSSTNPVQLPHVEENARSQSQYFPMRLSPSGARSLLFANFWAALLQLPLSWLGLGDPFANAWGFAVLVLLTEAATLFDITPRQVSRFLAATNAGIHGLTPGDETHGYLVARRQQLKLLNAALLACLSLAARGVDSASQALIGLPLGCLSLLLLASTVTSAARLGDSGFMLNDGVCLEGAIVVVGGMYAIWKAGRVADVTVNSLALVRLLRPVPDLIVLGCGSTLHQLPASLTRKLHQGHPNRFNGHGQRRGYIQFITNSGSFLRAFQPASHPSVLTEYITRNIFH